MRCPCVCKSIIGEPTMAGVSGRSGGARIGSGGARPGAGRPKKLRVEPAPKAPCLSTCKCGAVFEQTGRGLKKQYCSATCRASAKYDRRSRVVTGKRKRLPVSPTEKICAHTSCGKQFAARHKSTKYCSPDCYRKAQQTLTRVAGERRSGRDRSNRECKQCGSRFEPSYGDPRRTYCSAKCRKQACSRGGGDTHRERAKKFGVRYEPVHKVSVFVDCRWICQLCGKDTPRALMGTHDKAAPELDHIVPLAKGGDHVRANVQLACRGCNLSKGAKTGWKPRQGAGAVQSPHP
ncbi:HNH endonuclease [Massilia sp. X63]|uniref:HNH endonuclease n=1 Tax=Massilia sp. X63 TaxID=3237285 RepID=UPI0034DD1E22